MSDNVQTWRLPPRVFRVRRSRMPPCGCGCGKPAVWVGRGSRYANPFRAQRRIKLVLGGGRTTSTLSLRPMDRETAIALFADYVTDGIEDLQGHTYHHQSVDAVAIRTKLAGHDLACDCSPVHPCHATALFEIANQKEAR